MVECYTFDRASPTLSSPRRPHRRAYTLAALSCCSHRPQPQSREYVEQNHLRGARAYSCMAHSFGTDRKPAPHSHGGTSIVPSLAIDPARPHRTQVTPPDRRPTTRMICHRSPLELRRAKQERQSRLWQLTESSSTTFARRSSGVTSCAGFGDCLQRKRPSGPTTRMICVP